MKHNIKSFAQELNKSMDEMEAPANIRERAVILSKILQIPKQQAWGLLEGQIFPDEELLQRIANELEMNIKSLTPETK